MRAAGGIIAGRRVCRDGSAVQTAPNNSIKPGHLPDVPHFSRLIWPPTLVGSVPAVGRVGDAEQVEDLPL
jgi:hypothetical protein